MVELFIMFALLLGAISHTAVLYLTFKNAQLREEINQLRNKRD